MLSPRFNILTVSQALHKCVHSQYDFAHLTLAINQITWKCTSLGTPIHFGTTPIPDRGELRRREKDFVAEGIVFGSASAKDYPRGSVILPTQSAYAAPSVGYITSAAGNGRATSAATPGALTTSRTREVTAADTSSSSVIVADMIVASILPNPLRDQFFGTAVRNDGQYTFFLFMLLWLLWLTF